MTDGINHFDLAFVIDTTGSMGGLIGAAQQQMVSMIRELALLADVDLMVAVVQYRDHPPQDQLVSEHWDFSADLGSVQAVINGLSASGGGDGPEAVLDGVRAACDLLSWRPHSRRVAVLIGDAPPHGVGSGGDAFPDGCPCGDTVASVTAAAEERRITLHGLALQRQIAEVWTQLSNATGGEYFSASQGNHAITLIKEMLLDEFGDLEFDQRVLAAWRDGNSLGGAPGYDDLAQQLESSRPAVAAALSRLGARGLLHVHP
ncbi:MAG TPA: vWA domain-containing protein [Herpetosiphonaceae bacterium]